MEKQKSQNSIKTGEGEFIFYHKGIKCRTQFRYPKQSDEKTLLAFAKHYARIEAPNVKQYKQHSFRL